MAVYTRVRGFKGEFLWELEIAERQLLALAEAFPAERYGWRPDGARSVSEVIVHVAAGNFMLLAVAGISAAPDVYGQIEGETPQRMFAMDSKNQELEKNLTERTQVIAFLRRSLAAMRESFTKTSEEELERREMFFFEQTTVRRVYLRGLTHTHEHMGQLIAYTRAMGAPAPWPDWRKSRPPSD
jgi:uncharacterized damage-inducible protein DinB